MVPQTNQNPSVLLINPRLEGNDAPHVPLGLADLKAYLRSKDINVSIYDTWALNPSENEIRERLRESRPDLIGITVCSFTLKEVKMLAGLIHEELPETHLTAGGPHPSYDPLNFLTWNTFFHSAVLGEGEETLHELVSTLHKPSRWSSINGLAFRDNHGIIHVNSPRRELLALDTLPLPDFEGFSIDHYHAHPPYGKREPFFNLITSRGCPYNCVFCSCSVFGQRTRLKSAQRIMAEVDLVYRKFGIREIHFYDDVFTINRKRTLEFCRLIRQSDYELIWSCTTRVDLVDQELLFAMKKAGCWMVTFGVESGNDSVLEKSRKQYRRKDIIAAFKMARKAGLKIHSFWLINLPGDTPETIMDTINFAREIKPDSASVNNVRCLPGSPLYEEVRDGMDEYVPINYKGNFSEEQVEHFRKLAIRRIYFSPWFLMRTFLSIRSPRRFLHFLRAGWRLFSRLFA